MNIHGHLRIFAFLIAMMPLHTFAQHTRQALLEPRAGDYNLRGAVKEMVVRQHYEGGNDVDFQETYSFGKEGLLREYVKQGFGGRRVTSYPLQLSDLEGDAERPSRRYTFADDGDLLELRQYDRQGRLYTTTHCIYAAGGYLTQTVEYAYDASSGGVTKRTVSLYDKHSRLVTVEQYSADELLLWSEKRAYDRRGNLKRRVQTFYGDDGTETTDERRSYTYDARGNWTQCRYTLNGKAMYTIEREIEYYGD